jgi:hypothetical protein
MRGVPDRSVTVRQIPIEQLDLSSKRLTVIGGTNGLGRAIARQALTRGVRECTKQHHQRDRGTSDTGAPAPAPFRRSSTEHDVALT